MSALVVSEFEFARGRQRLATQDVARVDFPLLQRVVRHHRDCAAHDASPARRAYARATGIGEIEPGLLRRFQRLLRRIGLGRRPAQRRDPRPRAVAVVVDGGRVLVMKRHKRGRHYAVLPGGGIEAGETAAEAALRELHEETTLRAEIDRLLWTGRHNDRPAWYFLMRAVRGRAELSGPEAARNTPDNSFELVWTTADRFADLDLQPPAIRAPLAALLAPPGS